MKARLYRGPKDRRILEVQDHMSNIVCMPYKPGPVSLVREDQYLADIQFSVARYVRTKHTHPDGSVFFEWTEPKGTKIK